MNYVLFDHNRQHLLPFTHTRPIADIRCGIFTMRERWEHFLNTTTTSLTADYLGAMYPSVSGEGGAIYINGVCFADATLTAAIASLKPGQKLIDSQGILAAHTQHINHLADFEGATARLDAIQYEGTVTQISHVWDIFSLNDAAIKADFSTITAGRTSAPIPTDIMVRGAANIFIEPGAQIGAGCIINATTGPVYIGKDAELLEGVIVRGPLALCDHGVIKMGAKIYGATTIGPGCKVGGEISNVVFFANSNKGHDGFLGNAVIGEWCNLGADTNASNLKNNYDAVKIWDEHANRSIQTGLTFIGLIMGDHSKCGINTMFNTGTVVGVSCNIYGAGFPEKFVPSFTWGGAEKMTTYDFDRAMETANRMMARRKKQLSPEEKEMYRYVFEHTAKQRHLLHGSGE